MSPSSPSGWWWRYSWHSHLLLLAPWRVEAALSRLSAGGLPAPSLWQVELGVLRMWHRTLLRSETVGTSADPVRRTWRAQLLRWRPLRLPFLLWGRAVAPWDMSGLLSDPERICRHLLAAHHDRLQSLYDLQLLGALAPSVLPALRARIAAVVSGADPRAAWLRDLAVHEGYHENLLSVVDAFLEGDSSMSSSEADDPDISFLAYVAWCARQLSSPAATWAALWSGRYHLQHGIRDHADA